MNSIQQSLMKFNAQQFSHHGPLLPGVAPYGDGVKVFERVEVALVHCLFFFEVNLAYKFTIIAANNIRIVIGHFDTTSGDGPLLSFS